MEAKTFRHQAQTDHQQEAQTEHYNRRMLVDETGKRLRRQQHHRHRNHHGSHHHRQMVNHTHGGNHRVKGEDGIKDNDLRYHDPETRIAFAVPRVMLAVFQALMQLRRGLKQEEETPDEHDQIAP